MDSKVILNITGMSCTSCASNIERSLKKDKSVKDVKVNFALKKAYLTLDKNANRNNLLKIVKEAGYEATLQENTIKKEFLINGMSCTTCAINVEKSLKKIPGVIISKVNFADKKVTVVLENSNVKFPELAKSVKEAGYELVNLEEKESKEIEHLRKEKNRLIFAWIITLPLSVKMLFEMLGGIYLINQSFSFYADLILSFIVIFIIGFNVIKSTFFAIKNLSFNMDSLIGISTIAAFSTGILKLFGIQIENFTVVGAMIMSIDFIGNYLKEMATGRASQAIKQLLELGAKNAHLISNGEITDVSVDALKINDIVLIKPGEKIPVDGEIIEGNSSIDESIATGESIPVDKKAGDSVIGATINKQGTIKVKIKKIGKDTFLSQIIRMVEEAQGSKIPVQTFVDKITGIFVPIVLLISFSTFFFWLFLPDVGRSILAIFEPYIPWINLDRGLISMALFASIATLVIACPCALGLATPTALMVGMGKGAMNGILIRNGEAIQTAQKIDIVVFDKTGTITKGKPTLVEYKTLMDETEFLKIVGSVENSSTHPLASAIVNKIKEKNIKTGKIIYAENYPGKGIVAKIEDEKIIIGSIKYFDELTLNYDKFTDEIAEYQANGYSIVLVSQNNTVVGILGIADEIKNDSILAIKNLHKLGIKTVMITGDNRKSAESIAKKVNIDEVFAELLPENKIKIIKKLQNDHKIVAMVGDGINDAPALKQADVGIAIGTGTDIAIESADITLVNGSLTGVVKSIILSKATFKKIKQNLFWAFFYNVVAIPLAVFGLLHPAIAEIAMALSSVNVVGNSLKLKKISLKKF